MFVVFLGTGNALPSLDRANTALAVVAAPGRRAVMIDCGGDAYRQLLRAGLHAESVSDLIITHAHIDHIGGLPSLIESFRIAGRTSPLHIYAIEQPLQVARELLRAFAFELTLQHWPFPVELHLVQTGHAEQIGDFTVMPMPTDHTVPSIGMRMTATATPDGPVFAYTCDTRTAPMLADIARDATFFVAEATYFQGHEEVAQLVGHMTARQAAEVAVAGEAHALALVHLSVPNTLENNVQREARTAFRHEVFVPRDLSVFRVERRVRRMARLP
jgi:ribonuclease Z